MVEREAGDMPGKVLRLEAGDEGGAPVVRPGWRRVEGPYAYVMMALSFLSQLIMYGVIWGVGVYYVMFLEVFHASSAQTSWIGSITGAAFGFTGPVSSWLTTRFGCRAVAMAGGIVSSLGLIASAFATDVYHLYLTFGLLTGIGLGLAYIPVIVIVSVYFDSRRNLAVGMSVCGVGLGTFLFPPIIRHLWVTYGWRGSLLLTSAFTLQLCVFAALMVPPTAPATSRSSPRKYYEDTTGVVTGDKDWVSSPPHPRKSRVLLQLPYVLLCINNLLLFFGHGIILMHTPAFARDTLSLDDDSSSTLISVIGMSNLIGRIIYAILAHSPRVSPLALYQSSFLAVALLTLLCPLLAGYVALATYCALFGVLTAAVGTLLPPILISLVGLADMGRALGYVLIFEAVGSLLGAPAAGWLYDVVKAYDISIYLGGSAFLLAVLILGLPSLGRLRVCGSRRDGVSRAEEDAPPPHSPPPPGGNTPPPEYSSLIFCHHPLENPENTTSPLIPGHLEETCEKHHAQH